MPSGLPELEQLRAELKREKQKTRYNRIMSNTFYLLVMAVAASLVAASLWMPILQIYGASMTPTLKEGDIAVSVKGTDFENGDLIAFYLGKRLLVKRCIAGPGQWVNIDKMGNIYVDDELLNEPYIVEKALGACDIKLPYQVPENMWFVVGDHRATSIDSRNSTVGCVAEKQVVGRVVYRIWPLDKIGPLK